jgi:hypothetical protein
MSKTPTLIAYIAMLLPACNQADSTIIPAKSDERGVLNYKTEFFDSNGASTLLMPTKTWYRDSAAIEEVVIIRRMTDPAGRTTLSYPIESYKYIDLKNKYWAEYKTFSDSSRIMKSGVLPDSLLPGHGWAFHINGLPMKSEPEVLADTVIGNVKYMRIKFQIRKSKSTDTYVIGYLRYDNKGKLFSLEKKFSNKVNCTMTRCDEFREGSLKPFASSELEFLSDTLSSQESKVFDAWEQYAKKNPVRN